MSAFLRCSHCEKYCTAEDRLIGKKVRCPACGEVGLIKAQDGATAAYPARTEDRTKVLRPQERSGAVEATASRGGVPLATVFVLVAVTGIAALAAGIGLSSLRIKGTRSMRPTGDGAALPVIEPPSMAAYLAERPANPVRFQVQASLSNVYASYSRSSHYSIRLQEPAGFNFLHGYIPRDGSDGQRLFALLQDGQEHPLRVVMRLVGPNGRTVESNEVLIESFEEMPARHPGR